MLVAGIVLGAMLFGGSADTGDEAAADAEQAQAHDHENGDEAWTCPMHPSVREDGPGDCPICGMELVRADEVDDEGQAQDEYSMVMSESAAQLARVQTTEVERGTPSREIELPGRVKVDERNITTITSHFPGRIRDLKVDFTGAYIEEGQPMASIYSPELISAQRELLEAKRYEETSPEMVESARQKLRLWELSEREINRIEESGEVHTELEIDSPVSGYVLDRRVSHEEHIDEGTILYEVADLDDVWVVFEAYEEDLQWLQEGDEVSFRMRSNPGENHTAQITYIDPVVDGGSRTARVRAEMSNPQGELKPDMLVRGTVHSEMAEGLMVPKSAVLWTGPRSLVYVKDTDADVPRFEVRDVELGPRAGDFYVIEDGVEEGEHVVFHGAFRLDSEMQLADRFSMMNREPGAGAVPAHDHGDGDHDEHDDHDAQEHEDHAEHENGEHDFARPPSYRDEATEAFQAQLTNVVEAYLDVRDAFVESNEEAARAHLADVDAALDAVDMMELEGDAHDAWMQDLEAMQSHLDHVDHAEHIDHLRAEFSTLSQILAYSAEQFGIEGSLYRKFCPMAFDEDGAYWLSRDDEIQNPYLPETMLTCGEVIEQLDT